MDKIKLLDSLKADVLKCKNCPLHEGRTNTVFGEGSITANLMIIGEGPGFNEDQEGRPFVGRSGKKLTQWLESIGLDRRDVFITNIVKCRPPDNRDPKPEEVKACRLYLLRQILLISPKLICTLGRPATNTMLGLNEPMKKLKNKELKFHHIPVIPLFHPAYILRNIHAQKEVDVGLGMIKEFLDEIQ